MTDGVVTILPEAEFMAVLGLWDRLETACGLNGVRITPYPHFSWQIGDGYDVPAVKAVLQGMAQAAVPFEVAAGGIGIFSGPSPVIYIPVIASQALLDLHQRVWDALYPLGNGLSPLYAPCTWVPHITVGFGDVNAENLGKAVRLLNEQPLQMRFPVNNLSYIHQAPGETGRLVFGLPFLGQ